MARPSLVLAALAAACALCIVAAGRPPATLAADGLIITSDARYEVRPTEGVVVVTIDAVATNVTPDTPTEQFYYTGVTMPVLPGASGFVATSGGAALPISISESTDDYVAVDVTFNAEVLYQQTYRFQLSFVLADDGGEAEHDTRIRESFVAFPVWAFASPDGTDASVEVAWPPGYDVSVLFGEMRQLPTDSGAVLTARQIEDPTTFVAYVTGERDGARTSEEIAIGMADGDVSLLMLAWSDDPDWLRRQTEVLSVGLPALERAIGLDYPITGTLSVSEHAHRQLGDFVGVFNRAAATIQMRYDADTFTTLHEAAHVWFNGDMFDERWILEGFASYYAEVVGTELQLAIVPDELTAEIALAEFPLNAWLAPTFDEEVREAYAYAAAPEVAAQIAALAGADNLRKVWAAADAEQLAYAARDPDVRDATDPQPESWQRFLDLLENLTAADYDPIWREWVVTDAEAALLDARDVARTRFDEAMSAADGWFLPRSTRLLMDAWDFAAAEAELVEAHEIFDDRAALDALATELDLVPTDALRAAFEDEGLSAAEAEVDEQRGALDAIGAAADALDSEWNPIEAVGLLGETDPSVTLGEARVAYENGDDEGAHNEARSAIDERAATAERGRLRIGIAAGASLIADVLAIAAVAFRRRRRPAPVELATG